MNICDFGSSKAIITKLNHVSLESGSFVERLIQREPTFEDFLNVWTESIEFNVSEFLQSDLSNDLKNTEVGNILMKEMIHSIEESVNKIHAKKIEKVNESFNFQVQKDYQGDENKYILIYPEKYRIYNHKDGKDDLIQFLCNETKRSVCKKAKRYMNTLSFYGFEHGVDKKGFLIKDFRSFVIKSLEKDILLESISMPTKQFVPSIKLKPFIDKTNKFLDNQLKDLQMFWTDLFDMFTLLKNAKKEYTENVKQTIAS